MISEKTQNSSKFWMKNKNDTQGFPSSKKVKILFSFIEKFEIKAKFKTQLENKNKSKSNFIIKKFIESCNFLLQNIHEQSFFF